MDPTVQQWRFQPGDKVCAADDADLGKVVGFAPDAVKPTHLGVEKGLLRRQELRVPFGAVCNDADGTSYLDRPKAAVEAAGAG